MGSRVEPECHFQSRFTPLSGDTILLETSCATASKGRRLIREPRLSSERGRPDRLGHSRRALLVEHDRVVVHPGTTCGRSAGTRSSTPSLARAGVSGGGSPNIPAGVVSSGVGLVSRSSASANGFSASTSRPSARTASRPRASGEGVRIECGDRLPPCGRERHGRRVRGAAPPVRGARRVASQRREICRDREASRSPVTVSDQRFLVVIVVVGYSPWGISRARDGLRRMTKCALLYPAGAAGGRRSGGFDHHRCSGAEGWLCIAAQEAAPSAPVSRSAR